MSAQASLNTCIHLCNFVKSNHRVFPHCDEFSLRHWGRANGGIKTCHITGLTEMVKGGGGGMS